jgi:hypothetical protein
MLRYMYIACLSLCCYYHDNSMNQIKVEEPANTLVRFIV